MGFDIRELELKDFLGVVSLVKNEMGCGGVSSNIYDRIMQIYHNPNYVTFVVELDGSIVGFVGAMRGLSFEMDGEYVRIVAMAVKREYLGNGIGTLLVGRVEDYALEIGANSIAITSGLKRSDIHSFYEKMGYQKKGCTLLKPLPIDKEPTYDELFSPIPHREN